MNRNIEIKAHLSDYQATFALVRGITKSEPVMLRQTDTYFKSPNGRLKLRTINQERSELIYYRRPDQTNPKASDYLLVQVPDPESMREILGLAFGIRGTVRKRRALFMIGPTRIHLDQVEGLGDFIEFEVVLPPHETAEEGIRIANELLDRLKINNGSLVSGSYIDLMDLPSAGRQDNH